MGVSYECVCLYRFETDLSPSSGGPTLVNLPAYRRCPSDLHPCPGIRNQAKLLPGERGVLGGNRTIGAVRVWQGLSQGGCRL